VGRQGRQGVVGGASDGLCGRYAETALDAETDALLETVVEVSILKLLVTM
jgi:hypothetical protein